MYKNLFSRVFLLKFNVVSRGANGKGVSMLGKVTVCVLLMLLAIGYGQVLFSGARAVPKMLGYQGFLTDGTGVPIDDSLDMTFRIMDAETNGSEWWAETQTRVPVEDGSFSVLLGSVNEIPDTAFTQGIERWLEMIIDGTDTLQPRTRIASAAYAYTATFSDTAEYAKNAAADNDWTRGTPDSVLFTKNFVGIARGGAGNTFYGDSVHTHVCLGVSSHTGDPFLEDTCLYCTVSGGKYNSAEHSYSAVGGGYSNHAYGRYTTVAGGNNNIAYAISGTVGGGEDNMAWKSFATVSGGQDNTALADCATVGGGVDNVAMSDGATVGGGEQNRADGYGATVAGGYRDTASDEYAAVCGGYGNAASGGWAVVCGGLRNAASGSEATVSGGIDNSATDNYATVAGGYENTASTLYATVGGGSNNTASSIRAVVGGGSSNAASGGYSTVAGGFQDTSSGSYSFTVGDASKASHTNSAAFNGQATTASGQTRVGTISKAAGTFTIDHPLDPMNKILNHYFVESPEMVLIYRGSVKIGADGMAVVHLPEYYDALNKNPLIQLTGVGTSNVYIVENVNGNSFIIGGNVDTEVHWTVTAERTDQSAEITKIIMPVEQLKEGELAGRSLDDDFLATTMSQLEEMGRADGFRFRTTRGQQKYENSKARFIENR